jgi:hypothetical protein
MKAESAPIRIVMSQPIFSLPGWINLARIPTTIPIKRYQRTLYKLILSPPSNTIVIHIPVQRVLIERDTRT